MSKLGIAEALRECIRQEMNRDETVFCIGEDIAIPGGWDAAAVSRPMLVPSIASANGALKPTANAIRMTAPQTVWPRSAASPSTTGSPAGPHPREQADVETPTATRHECPHRAR